MTACALLQFVHVLLAIVAVGFNASYGIWLARITTSVIVVAIVFLMVAKPTLA